MSWRKFTWVRVLLRGLVGALIAVNYDLSFDTYMSQSIPASGSKPAKPAAWIWTDVTATTPDQFFGVPFHNFYGWMVTAIIILLVFRFVRPHVGPIRPLGPHTTFAVLAPVFFYLTWWLGHWTDGYPTPVKIVACISLGIPAVAAFLESAVRTQDQEITGEEPGS